MLGGFHWYDLLPVILIGILIFGPKKLPELGASVGKTIKEFQKSMRDVKETSAQTPETPQVSATRPAELAAPTATQQTTDPAQQ